MTGERCRQLATELADSIGEWFSHHRHGPGDVAPFILETIYQAVAEESEACAAACVAVEEIDYNGRKDGPETATQEACAKACRERWKLFTHDCDHCVFLGPFFQGGKRYDLYFAGHSEHAAGQAVIARYGNAPEENSSWPVRSAETAMSWHAEAKRRAATLGLLKEGG